MAVFKLVLFVISLGLTGCNIVGGGKKSDESSSDDNDESAGQLESDPKVGALAVGGMPQANELGALLPLSAPDAHASAKKISNVQGSLAISLTNKQDGAALSEGDCEGTFFCFAKAFTDIYDMVTEAAQCNFDLLLGPDPQLKQVDQHPVFYIDGFGTIGLSDNGVQCPTRAAVDAFVAKVKAGQHTDDEEFHLPTRLVLFKKNDGKVHWRLIFFPEDFIDELSDKIHPFKQLLDKQLDFLGFHGHHDIAYDVGKGDGQVILDFDEMYRMFSLLETAFEEGDAKEEEDDSFPQGKIDITYDLTAQPQKFTTVFKDNFTFGDGDDPFTDDLPTTIMRTEGENYLHFYSDDSFIGDDEDSDQTGPLETVQFCTPDDIYIKDIKDSDKLATPSTTHVQIIWRTLHDGQEVPDKFIARIVQTKGGPFIYGNTIFEGAQNGDKELNVIRVKAPRCDELDDATMAMKGITHDGTFLNSDGFVNASSEKGFSDEGGQISWISSADAIAKFPAFDDFRFIDPSNASDTPLGASGSAITVPDVDLDDLPDSGYCHISDDICYAFEDLSFKNLAFMRRACGSDSNEGGFDGIWHFKSACPQGAARVCSVTDFQYGDSNSGLIIESVDTHMYSDTPLSGQNLCTVYGGTVTPPLIGTCNSPAQNTCHEFASIPVHINAGLQSHCAQPDNGGFNGTWTSDLATCSSTGLQGTCSWTFNYGSVPITTTTKLYGNVFGPFTAQQYCETAQSGGGLEGTYTAN